MIRRLAATLLALLVLTVVSAAPASAKSDKDKKDAGSVPVTTGQESGTGSTGGTDDSSGGGTDTGAGAPGTGPGSKPGNDPTTEDPGSKGNGTGKDTSDTPTKATASPRPAQTGSSSSATGAATTITSPSERSVVRAWAAPAAPNSGVTALLPAPNPMLLPDSSTTDSAAAIAAPVDVERSSSLPQALPALLIGVGLLSVAVFGTLLARRRIAQPSA